MHRFPLCEAGCLLIHLKSHVHWFVLNRPLGLVRFWSKSQKIFTCVCRPSRLRWRLEVRLPLLWREEEEEEEEERHTMVHKCCRQTNWQTHKKRITWCLIKDWTLNLSQLIIHFSALQCYYMHLYFSNILKLTCNEVPPDSSMTSFNTWFYDILHHLRQNTSATSNTGKTPAGLG